jgi:hypothetical protein
MKRNISIQLKAAFLLMVFAMNTVVGLACAVGFDMSFNSKHHNEEQTIKTPIHVHANGHKHDHNNEVNKHKHVEKKAPEKDGCCNDEVVKIQNVEKNLTLKTVIDAPAFVAILSSFFGIELFNSTKAFPQKNIVRFFYPPPPDILISIQKFQV